MEFAFLTKCCWSAFSTDAYLASVKAHSEFCAYYGVHFRSVIKQ